MARLFCVPGVAFLVAATVLSILVSISLPFLPALDITRVHFATSLTTQESGRVAQIRLGIWSFCNYAADTGARTCSPTGHGYAIQIQGNAANNVVNIGSSWTRGLAIHPVAAAVTFIALLFSLSQHVTMTLIASLLSFLAALITLIAFAVDIALLAFLRHEVGDLINVRSSVLTGPGFWLTFASLILLLLAGCTVCFGRRRDRYSGASAYPISEKRTFFSRFRRN